jgi:hypothetical protein
VAAISAVFTIGYVANLLGEDEDWLFDLSNDMFPEDGCLWVHPYQPSPEGLPGRPAHRPFRGLLSVSR